MYYCTLHYNVHTHTYVRMYVIQVSIPYLNCAQINTHMHHTKCLQHFVAQVSWIIGCVGVTLPPSYCVDAWSDIRLFTVEFCQSYYCFKLKVQVDSFVGSKVCTQHHK